MVGATARVALEKAHPPVHYISLQTNYTLCSLAGEIDRSCFSHDGYFDLAGIIEAFFDFVGDIAGELAGSVFVDFFGLDDDTHLASGLDCERFFDACKRVGNRLQSFKAFNVQVNGLAARAGASG